MKDGQGKPISYSWTGGARITQLQPGEVLFFSTEKPLEVRRILILQWLKRSEWLIQQIKSESPVYAMWLIEATERHQEWLSFLPETLPSNN